MKRLLYISVVLVLTALFFTACISNKQPAEIIKEIQQEGMVLRLKDNELTIYTEKGGADSYEITLSGVNVNSSLINIEEDYVSFLKNNDSKWTLYTAKKDGMFEAEQLIGRMKIKENTLSGLTIKAKNYQLETEKLSQNRGDPSLLGDFNNDSVVDVKDLNLFIQHFGTESAEFNIGPAEDTNGDGIKDTVTGEETMVDAQDLIVLSRNYEFGDIHALLAENRIPLLRQVCEKINKRVSSEEDLTYADAFLIMAILDGNNLLQHFLSEDLTGIPQELLKDNWELNRRYENYHHMFSRVSNLIDAAIENYTENIEVHFSLFGGRPYENVEKIIFDELSLQLLKEAYLTTQSIIKGLRAYNLPDYEAFIQLFNTDDSGYMAVDSNNDGKVTPDEFLSNLPGFGFPRIEDYDELKQTAAEGLEAFNLRENWLEQASSTTYFNEDGSVKEIGNFVPLVLSGEFTFPFKHRNVENLEQLNNMITSMNNLEPFMNLFDFDSHEILVSYFIDYFTIQESQKREGESVTINLGNVFSTINDLVPLLPTFLYHVESATTTTVSATLSFNNNVVDQLFPIEKVEGIKKIVQTFQDAIPLYYDAALYTSPTPVDPGEGLTIEVLGVDGQPADYLYFANFETDLEKDSSNGQIYLEPWEIHNGWVFIRGRSQSGAVMDGKTHSPEFRYAGYMNFDSMAPRGTMTIDMREEGRSIRFNPKVNGNAISSDVKFKVNYGGYIDDNGYPDYLGELDNQTWVRMRFDEFYFTEAMIAEMNYDIYDKATKYLSGDFQEVNINLTNNRATLKMADERQNLSYNGLLLESDGMHRGKKPSMKIENNSQVEINGGYEYRVVNYAEMADEVGDFYQYYTFFTDKIVNNTGYYRIYQGQTKEIKLGNDYQFYFNNIFRDRTVLKYGEWLEGRIWINDQYHNILYWIEKRRESEENHPRMNTLVHNLEEDATLQSNQTVERTQLSIMEPTIEIRDPDGVTIYQTHSVFMDFQINEGLKPGVYKLYVKWDTGPLAGIIQEVREFTVKDESFDVELGVNRDRDHEWVEFNVNFFNDQKFDDVKEVYVQGPGLDKGGWYEGDYVEGKGLILRENDWNGFWGRVDFVSNEESEQYFSPDIGTQYTVFVEEHNGTIKTIKKEVLFKFYKNQPNITYPEFNQEFSTVQPINVTWEPVNAADSYEVTVKEFEGHLYDGHIFYRKRVYNQEGQLTLPAELFEINKSYVVEVTAFKERKDEVNRSYASNMTVFHFGEFKPYQLRVTLELWYDKDVPHNWNRGMDIWMSFLKPEDVKHIWVSGPRIDGSFDLKAEDWDVDNPNVFSCFYTWGDELHQTIQTGDTYMFVIEYEDGSVDTETVTFSDVSKTYPTFTSPQVKQQFGENENIPIRFEDAESSSRGISNVGRYIVLSYLDQYNNWCFIRHFQVTETSPGIFESEVPYTYLEKDKINVISVNKTVQYDDNYQYNKKIVKTVPIIVGEPPAVNLLLELEHYRLGDNGETKFEEFSGAEFLSDRLHDRFQKLEWHLPDQNIMPFKVNVDNPNLYKSDGVKVEEPLGKTHTYKFYFNNPNQIQVEEIQLAENYDLLNLSETNKISYPTNGQIFEEPQDIRVQFQTNNDFENVWRGLELIKVTDPNNYFWGEHINTFHLSEQDVKNGYFDIPADYFELDHAYNIALLEHKNFFKLENVSAPNQERITYRENPSNNREDTSNISKMLQLREVNFQTIIIGEVKPYKASVDIWNNVDRATADIGLYVDFSNDYFNEIESVVIEVEGQQNFLERNEEYSRYEMHQNAVNYEDLPLGQDFNLFINFQDESKPSEAFTVHFPEADIEFFNTNFAVNGAPQEGIESGTDIQLSWQELPGTDEVCIPLWRIRGDGHWEWLWDTVVQDQTEAVIPGNLIQEEGFYVTRVEQRNGDYTSYKEIPFYVGDTQTILFEARLHRNTHVGNDKFDNRFQLRVPLKIFADEITQVYVTGDNIDGQLALDKHEDELSVYYEGWKHEMLTGIGDIYTVHVVTQEGSLYRKLLDGQNQRGEYTQSVEVTKLPGKVHILTPEDQSTFNADSTIPLSWTFDDLDQGLESEYYSIGIDRAPYEGDWEGVSYQHTTNNSIDINLNQLMIPAGERYAIHVNTNNTYIEEQGKSFLALYSNAVIYFFTEQ